MDHSRGEGRLGDDIGERGMTRLCRNLNIRLHGLQMQHALDATILRTNLETQAIVLPGRLGLRKGHSLLVTYVGALE